MIQAVIFDMDGVIVDSEKQWQPVQMKFLQSLIPSINESDLEKFIGTSLDNGYKHLSQYYSLKMSKRQFKKLYDDLAKDVYTNRVSLMPGFTSLIKRLQKKKILLALASSSPKSWISIVLKRFMLEEIFQVVISADHLEGEGKPSPRIYLLAAEKLHVKPTECMAIEDSINGVISAKAAGMKCICIPDPRLKNSKQIKIADYIFNSLEDIDETLLQNL